MNKRIAIALILAALATVPASADRCNNWDRQQREMAEQQRQWAQIQAEQARMEAIINGERIECERRERRRREELERERQLAQARAAAQWAQAPRR